MVQRLIYAIHDFTWRQFTWFHKDKRIMWINGGEWEQADELVRDFLTDYSDEKKSRDIERDLIARIRPLLFQPSLSNWFVNHPHSR